MPYQFVKSLRRYRDTITGRFVAQETLDSYVADIIDAGSGALDLAADMVADGRMSPDNYIDLLREELKSTYIQQYVLGRGGRASMTPSDWGSVGAMLKRQYAYAEGFRERLREGSVSADYVRARSLLYFRSSRSAYERGDAAAHGVPRLPAYPCDGSTECQVNCGCHWRFVHLSGEGNVDCYWEIDPSLENCPQCIERNLAWYPLQVRGGELLPYLDIRAEAHVHEELAL